MPEASEVPPFRPLRVFAFDPSLALQLKTLDIHEIAVRVPWERDPELGKIAPGPIGEYLEIIDVDPASGVAYAPIDLDDPKVLAQDGLSPSEGNPQFHQQMVYAVAMSTIGHFERALGRVALWAAHRPPGWGKGNQWDTTFVRRLRLYPHALRDQNAYYSPAKKAILFGYFPVRAKDAYNTPGTTVFTCLSHDIIAHEVTHALLDGLHPRFTEANHPDVLAFHEAFADIVALFQHFSYPAILRDQIARTSGDLHTENLLGQLAREFGLATGRGKALRDYVGTVPNPKALESVQEPHARGAILVAAVFNAFLRIYRAKTRDLFRIASNGTGILPKGDLHPDLVNRLAQEASRAALSALHSCIRALDYCPPVNITFGHYLRALVTADWNSNPEPLERTAIIESFREWGIYPRGIRSMSVESLLWPCGTEVFSDMTTPVRTAKSLADADSDSKDALRDLFSWKVGQGDNDAAWAVGNGAVQLSKWGLNSDRFELWKSMESNRRVVWEWLIRGSGRKHAPALGVNLDTVADQSRRSIFADSRGIPKVEVHSVRNALRRDSRGGIVSDLIIEITQRRRGYFNQEDQDAVDTGKKHVEDDEHGDFVFRAGSTVVIDTTNCEFRHIIKTAGNPSVDTAIRGTIADDVELKEVRKYLTGTPDASDNAFAGERVRSLLSPFRSRREELFGLLHRHAEGL